MDIGSLLAEESKDNPKAQELKKKLSIAILQTHRFFSDLDDDEEEEVKQNFAF